MKILKIKSNVAYSNIFASNTSIFIVSIFIKYKVHFLRDSFVNNFIDTENENREIQKNFHELII